MLCERGRRGEAILAGGSAWGKRGVIVSQMGDLPVALYGGEMFDKNTAVVLPKNREHLPAIWAYCSSPGYSKNIRLIDQSMAVTNRTMVKVPFDLPHWQKVAAEKYPDGLPEPESDDPTQWLFHGRPEQSTDPLQVAVARLVGYRWPAESDPDMRLSTRARDLVNTCGELDEHADADGIVPLPAVGGEDPADARLARLLAAAYGDRWTDGTLDTLLADAGHAGKPLAKYLRNEFFRDHVRTFKNRPFVWHVWDGRPDGFAALVNYHKLAAPDGGGKKTLSTLTNAYLRDWIDRQEGLLTSGDQHAADRLLAAKHLKKELEKIAAGEPPYDLFVRWKPLHEQPVGWDPDVNDGVRLNARPFLAARPLNASSKYASIFRRSPGIKLGSGRGEHFRKDKGKEPKRDRESFPWFWAEEEPTGENFTAGESAEFHGHRFNALHYTTDFKKAAQAAAGAGDG